MGTWRGKSHVLISPLVCFSGSISAGGLQFRQGLTHFLKKLVKLHLDVLFKISHGVPQCLDLSAVNSDFPRRASSSEDKEQPNALIPIWCRTNREHWFTDSIGQRKDWKVQNPLGENTLLNKTQRQAQQ
ncbi:hypothetical protein L484_003189 [Morus notabilis]|uniref:Uncharacterized protein n=1 Tax=Morus notabilis TaxID=981085 RepID=W9QRF4_9ROSA|nr:hypothetical protein L484_003189 [Morus notabilis]